MSRLGRIASVFVRRQQTLPPLPRSTCGALDDPPAPLPCWRFQCSSASVIRTPASWLRHTHDTNTVSTSEIRADAFVLPPSLPPPAPSLRTLSSQRHQLRRVAPVAAAHTMAHIAAVVSIGAGAVGFVQVSGPRHRDTEAQTRGAITVFQSINRFCWPRLFYPVNPHPSAWH